MLSRDLVRETQLSVKDLIYPIFVVDTPDAWEPILSMLANTALDISALST